MRSLSALLLGIQILAMHTAEGATSYRDTASFPGSIAAFSAALGLGAPDPGTVMLRTVRLVYGRTESQGQHAREALLNVLEKSTVDGTDHVPLPLNRDVWSELILRGTVDDRGIVSAILKDRSSAFLYYGLSALDDETLQWVATSRNTLLAFRKHPEVFAAFGRSVRVRGGRVIVPGGSEAEPAWRSVTNADPSAPEAFVEGLMSGDGRLAFLYDVVAHLDEPHQRFALGLRAPPGSREGRLHSLLTTFTTVAPEWKPAERPFSRPPLDGAILFSTIAVTTTGDAVPPLTRRLWDRVFRADDLNDVPYEKVSDTELRAVSGSLALDAPWLADRILRVPYAIGRRRLDALLFAQRVFAASPGAESASVATALRGYLSFPALMGALEGMGIRDPDIYVRAAEHAARLSALESALFRRTALAEFQSTLALMARAHRAQTLNSARATTLLTSLCGLEVTSRDAYGSRFATWLRDRFMAAFSPRGSLEEALLAAVAGAGAESTALPIIEWEGKRYRVDPAAAELRRLQLVREKQGGVTLDEALSAASGQPADGRSAGSAHAPEQRLADTLTAIVYAMYLGDPEGAAVTSGNVALRHDFGLPAGTARGVGDAWRLPIERFDNRTAWRVRGSLLGLESALSRLALRRIDRTDMPREPTIGPQDRQTIVLTAALMNPFALSDQARDAIAAAITQGRRVVRTLADDPSRLNEVARAAGLSEWRTQALSWRVSQGLDPFFDLSILDLYWIGSSRTDHFDAWGAAVLPLTGCLCAAMPAPSPWEDSSGYASAVLATRSADVPLRLAEALAALKLPAMLAPALAGFVTQDVVDHAQLAYSDDWEQFGRAVLDIPTARLSDYVAALTAGGPLMEIR
jgi:hypothetical protein